MAKIYIIEEVEGEGAQRIIEQLMANGMAWRCGAGICVNEEGAQRLLEARDRGEVTVVALREAAPA